MTPEVITAPAVAVPAAAAPASAAAALAAPASAALAKPIDLWPQLLFVSTSLSVHVPLLNLTVRELFRLDKGSIVASSQPSGANVPLCVGARVIAWGEFQVFGDNLALRIAELA